jgi:hypothetical protein
MLLPDVDTPRGRGMLDGLLTDGKPESPEDACYMRGFRVGRRARVETPDAVRQTAIAA